MERGLAESVWRRAQECCEYCRVPQSGDPLPFQIDHIIARQHGGATVSDNLALACYSCNRHKGPNIAGFDASTQRTIPLFHPRRDTWADHFQWRGPQLSGLTATGRVTVHVLAINLDFRIALRRALMQEGLFPPP